MRRVVILKYTISPLGLTRIEMPVLAKVVSAQNQREKLVLWAEVPVQPGDHYGATGTREFLALMTGDHTSIPDKAAFVGTVQFDGGRYVAHVYEGYR